MKQATETRDLPVRLTAEEMRQVAAALADRTVARTKVQAEKDGADEIWRGVIKGHDAEIDRLAKLYGDGAEERPVECRREYDLPHNVYRVVRTDTGEAVIERAMTAEELEKVRQGDLFPPASAIGGPEPTKDEASRSLAEVAKRAGDAPKKGTVH